MAPLWLLFIGRFVVLGGILLLRLHPFLALIAGALIVGSLTGPEALEQFASDTGMTAKETTALLASSVGERLAFGFGRKCAQIGILIDMASILGKFLLESGGRRANRSVIAQVAGGETGARGISGQRVYTGHAGVFRYGVLFDDPARQGDGDSVG